jgi:hypothetical protein
MICCCHVVLLAEMDPSTWEGAAYQMGNTPATWQMHYNPQQRLRAMQGAVDSNAAFTQRMREAQQQAQPDGASPVPIMVVPLAKRKRGA